jgi:hypothetical protein
MRLLWSDVSSSDTDSKIYNGPWTIGPLGDEWPPLTFPAKCEVVNAYQLLLTHSLPWLGQRTLLAAITRWREQGVISTQDVWKEACRWENLNPETAAPINTPVDMCTRAVQAQRHAWAQLKMLADSHMAEEPASPFDLDFDNADRGWPAEQENTAKGWLWWLFTVLNGQSYRRALYTTTIFGELPQNIKDALGREFAQDILETPYLFGNLLYCTTSHFWPGFGGPSTVLVHLAKKWNEVVQAEPPAQDRAFWQCVVQGFLYAAAHPDRNQAELAYQLDENHSDDVVMVVASLKSWAATPRVAEWIDCPGPGEALNKSIVYTDPVGLLADLFG